MDWLNSAWFWPALALALFALEALVPGVFMLWFGFAAAATALLVLLLPMSVDVQWIVFSILAMVAAGFGWRFRNRNTPGESDRPNLNQRAQQLLGQVHVLDRAIVNGRGRVKIGDAFWSTEGDDLPAGTRVRVIGTDGVSLRVAAEEVPASVHPTPGVSEAQPPG